MFCILGKVLRGSHFASQQESSARASKKRGRDHEATVAALRGGEERFILG
jgi:hypothetical protein